MFWFFKDNNQSYQIFHNMFQTKTHKFPKNLLNFGIFQRNLGYFWKFILSHYDLKTKTFLLNLKLFIYTEGVHNPLIMVLNWVSLNTTASLVHFGCHYPLMTYLNINLKTVCSRILFFISVKDLLRYLIKDILSLV